MIRCKCGHVEAIHLSEFNYACMENWCICKKFEGVNTMNTIDKLEREISAIKAGLSKLENDLEREKKRRKHDFAVVSVPVDMMDSEIRDERNIEPTRYTWVTGINGGFRNRVPIRLLSDGHLKAIFGQYVRGNHICYEEMKSEMLRRGLL